MRLFLLSITLLFSLSLTASASGVRPLDARIDMVSDMISHIIDGLNKNSDELPFDHSDYLAVREAYSGQLITALRTFEDEMETLLTGFEKYFQVLNSDFYSDEQKEQLLSTDQQYLKTIQYETNKKFYASLLKLLQKASFGLANIMEPYWRQENTYIPLPNEDKRLQVSARTFYKKSKFFSQLDETWLYPKMIQLSEVKKYNQNRLNSVGCQSSICFVMLKADILTSLEKVSQLGQAIEIPLGSYAFSIQATLKESNPHFEIRHRVVHRTAGEIFDIYLSSYVEGQTGENKKRKRR